MADEERPPTLEEIQTLRSLIGELDNEEQGKSSYYSTPRFSSQFGAWIECSSVFKVVFLIYLKFHSFLFLFSIVRSG